MKDECMIYFDCIEKFNDFYKNLKISQTWKINSGTLNTRGFLIQEKIYFKKLKNIFDSKGLFRRSVSMAEIVSFLDTYQLMHRVLNDLQSKVPQHILKRIKLYFEYRIRFSKNRRIDLVIQLDNKYLLCEFRLSSTFPNMSNMWQKKELELIIYKELLSNYLKIPSEIYLYAFIGMPEYEQSKPILKNIKYNKDNIEYFSNYIIEYLIKRANYK